MKDLIEELEKSQKTFREVTRILKDWGRLEKAESINLNKLQILQSRAKKIVEEVPDGPLKEKILIRFQELENEARRAMEEARFSFGRELEKALEKEGMPLEGRIPKFLVGPYGLEVDFERAKARITFGYDKVKDNLPLGPENIVKALIKMKKEIERAFDPQKSIDLVFDAYMRTLKILDRPMGERVPVMDLLQQMVFMIQGSTFRSDPRRENFRGLGRSQFAMMLYKIRDSGILARKRYALYLSTTTFDATRKRENFLWIPDNLRGEGTTYGYLSFREASEMR